MPGRGVLLGHQTRLDALVDATERLDARMEPHAGESAIRFLRVQAAQVGRRDFARLQGDLHAGESREAERAAERAGEQTDPADSKEACAQWHPIFQCRK